jgi:hypothetical protein
VLFATATQNWRTWRYATRARRARASLRTRVAAPPPPLPPVLIGHVSFLTPYQLDPPPASVPLKGCAASLSQGWIEREYRGPGGAAAADGVDAYVHACDRLGATPLPQARSSLEAHIQRT